MASALSNLSIHDELTIPNASDMKFVVVVSDWNPHITHALYSGCMETLKKYGADESLIFTTQVPGAFELPAAARMLASYHHPDAVICLGCVIKGDTRHDEYINQAVATGLTQLSIASGRPFIFGVLTTDNEEQALERAGGAHGNKGVEAAVTAIRMAALAQSLRFTKKSIGFGSLNPEA